MAVKLRMTRIGRRHRPFFRINAIDSRRPRDGRILEKLGHYDPIEKNKDKQIVLDLERVHYWLDKGAIPSNTVSQILLRLGVQQKYATEKAAARAKARSLAHAKGRYFTKADKIAADKAVAAAKEAKVEVEAKEKADVETQKKPQTEPKAGVEEENKVDVEPEVEAKTGTAEEKSRPQETKEEKDAASNENISKSDEN